MPEKKFMVVWDNEIIARRMKLYDAFILMEGLIDKHFNEKVYIRLVQEEDVE